MNAVEIVATAPGGTIIRTRHFTPEDVLREYAYREAQGHQAIHKEGVIVKPWERETCTKHPKPRRGSDHAH